MNVNHENFKSDINDINIENHLGLVHLCCQRFRKRVVDYEEIFQSGCVGLAKAAKNFDKNKGVKFSTYAVPVILGEIKSFFRDNAFLKVSRGLKEIAAKVKKEQEKFLDFYHREPTVKELSCALNIDAEQILEALDSARPLVSLDSSKQESEHENIEVPVVFEEEKISLNISLKEAINSFEPTDKNLIYLRFFKCMTQSKAAKILGMTQVQVSRREKSLLKLLRAKLG